MERMSQISMTIKVKEHNRFNCLLREIYHYTWILLELNILP